MQHVNSTMRYTNDMVYYVSTRCPQKIDPNRMNPNVQKCIPCCKPVTQRTSKIHKCFLKKWPLSGKNSKFYYKAIHSHISAETGKAEVTKTMCGIVHRQSLVFCPLCRPRGAISPKILVSLFPQPYRSAEIHPNLSSFREDIHEKVFWSHYNISVKPHEGTWSLSNTMLFGNT